MLVYSPIFPSLPAGKFIVSIDKLLHCAHVFKLNIEWNGHIDPTELEKRENIRDHSDRQKAKNQGICEQ